MKKNLFFLFIMIAAIVYAVPSKIDGSRSDITFEAAETNSTGTTLEFNLPDIEIKQVTISGKTYQRFNLESTGYTMKTGYPELPTYSTFVAIPNTGNVSLDMTVLEEQVYQDMDIYPAQEIRLDGSEPDFTIERGFYEGRKQWNLPSVEISEPMIMRDIRVASVTVNPMQYNPQTRELHVFKRVELNVRNEGGNGENEILTNRKLSRSFEKTYQAMIPNYEAIRDENPEYQKRSIIVVYPNNSTLEPYINSFVDWKRNKGFKVTLASTAETGTSTNLIKNYLQDVYEDSEYPPEYCVLVGDVGGTFNIPTWTENLSGYGGEGDYPFTLLAGNDYLPEMFIGRISISNINDMMVYLSKINIYEREVYMDEPEFYEKGLLVGDTSPSGLSCEITNVNIKEMILNNHPDFTFTELYSGDPSPNMMNNAMNAGTVMFNYRGYAGMSGYSDSHISSLTNYNRLVNTVINTCGTGTFAGTSRTELFIRAGTSNAPTGAITSIGMATLGTHTQFNNTLSGGTWAGIYEDGMRTMGEALVRGEMHMYQTYQNANWTQTQVFIHWCNLMGDPSCDIWAGMPIEMTAEYDTEIPKGQGYLDVDVVDAFSQPLEGVWVTARVSDETICTSEYTDENGHVTLMFDGSVTGNVNLTITKPDYLPILTTFNVQTSGGIAVFGTDIDDDSNGESIGNDDGDPNPGETVELILNLKNYGTSAYNDLTATLSTDDPYIDITDDEEDFGTISVGGTAECQDDFGFYIHPDCPDFHDVEFTLSIPNQGDVKFWIPIRGVDLDVTGMTVSDGGNGALDPGETSSFYVTVKNNGGNDLDDVYATLTALSSKLEIGDSAAYFGDITVNHSASCNTDGFVVTALSTVVTGMTLPVQIHFYNEAGYSEYETFDIPIGIVTETDPLGPDTYGYMCYDSGDTGYYQAPVYDWIEINPSLGGQGTNTGINDDTPEGESVDGIATVNLPFTFRFYGELYDQITISSNGWITMGETEQVTFRNFPIPGPMGPNPMIAAFWDDLQTGDGSIFTYYDVTENYFVIEWSNCRNSADYSTETFEVILFDPAFYPTNSGNGEIKIQYHTFNNVDGNNSNGGSQGNYCTIGLEDGTGLLGLQYSYDNEYPTAAMPLSNGTAILFTGVPLSLENPYLTMGDILMAETNGNGIIEPGETVNFGILLNNVGQGDATNVHATLSSSDPYVDITSTGSFFPDIEGGYSAYGDTYFSLSLSPDAPADHVMAFTLDIDCTGYVWSYDFSRIVRKPQLNVSLCLLNDSEGNGNGNADAGETIVFAIMIENPSEIDALNVFGAMSTNSGYADILTPEQSYGTIKAGSAIQVSYTIDISSATPSETVIPFDLDVTADNMDAVQFNLAIGSGLAPEILEEDFSTWLPEGWSIDEHSENWTSSNSNNAGGTAPEAKLNWSPSFNGISHLTTHSMNLIGATNVSIQFKHSLNDYSGSEYSLGLAMRSDSYNWTTIWEVTPSGSIPPETINVDIPMEMVNTTNIQFGWYLSGNSFNINYWFIDDIVLNAILGNSASISGVVTLDNELIGPETATVSIGDFAVHPDTTGFYMVYVSPSPYEELTGACYFFESASYNDLDLEFGDALEDYDFNLSYFTPPYDLSYVMEDDTIVLDWEYNTDEDRGEQRDERVDFLHFNIYRQIATGSFIELASTEEMTYSEVIDTTRDHQYYVQAVYATGVSDTTNHVSSVDWFPHGVNNGDVPVYVNNLGSNFPNPFNPETTIRFSLANDEKAVLVVYNIKGQRVRTLVNDKLKAGPHSVRWLGKNDAGKSVSSGVYFYKLEAGDYTSVRKMLLLK